MPPIIPVEQPDNPHNPPAGGDGGGGITPPISTTNLREGTNVSIRPSNLSSAHLYNLRNQSWAITRPKFNEGDNQRDCIQSFNVFAHVFPSNADSVSAFVYPNTSTSAGSKTVRRFDEANSTSSPQGNTVAPSGYFIIDALSRGSSRIAEVQKLQSQYPSLVYQVSALPADITPGGPTVICEYAGRVFYAGFSGELVDGDLNSPRMSSYILFSQLVADPSNISACYQANDPTDVSTPGVVDTDGGFLRVDGAYGIKALVNVGSGLAVLATNGVWIISGGSANGFTATNYKSTKITSSGCISSGSVCVVDRAFLYWGDDGIYKVEPNQFGDYVAECITTKTIKTFYSEIDPLDIASCEGIFDKYENKIKWVYGNRLGQSAKNIELVLDLTLGAFYKATIGSLQSTLGYPLVLKGFQTNPFKLNDSTQNVTYLGDQVNDTGIPVVVVSDGVSVSVKEVMYLVVTSNTPTIQISFGIYKEPTHNDWKSLDGVGVDAKSFLLTGYLSPANDFQRKKNATYMTTHLRKTETGFTTDSSGDYVPLDQSSCLIQVQWDWTNDPISGKWGRQFQAYRFVRQWFPTSVGDPFNNGYSVVETRNRIRGSGKVMSILISSEPNKHMELLGWSMVVEVNANV